jgi:hypothetical protein
MPSFALIRAADDLATALAGVIPPPSMTTDAIAQLINIFKTQAGKKKDEATLQRVLRENAQTDLFPQDIIKEYGLNNKVDTDGNVFCEVRRGMYGLPQAGVIAQELLTTRLHQAGYRQSKVTPGYWRHEWRPISFTLVVDDFGVKYINKTDIDHLISVLSQDYKIDTNWDGTRYLGLH